MNCKQIGELYYCIITSGNFRKIELVIFKSNAVHGFDLKQRNLYVSKTGIIENYREFLENLTNEAQCADVLMPIVNHNLKHQGDGLLMI